MTNSVWGSFGANVPTREVFATETFTVLRALTNPRSNANVTIEVDGGVTKGDGLGGIFYYDPSSVLADDNIDVIAPASGIGRWRRAITGLGIAITAGQIIFGAAGNAFAQDANLTWDNVNKKLSVATLGVTGGIAANLPGSPIFLENDRLFSWKDNVGGLTNTGFIWYTAAHQINFGVKNNTRWNMLDTTFQPQGNNIIDIGTATSQVRTGYFGTSIVTPLVTAPGNLTLSSLGAVIVSNTLQPNVDNSIALGFTGTGRWSQLFTPIIDSGSTGSLSLKVNGFIGLEIVNGGSNPDWPTVFGSNGQVFFRGSGASTNVNNRYATKGSGIHQFETDGFSTQSVELQILHTASAATPLTVTGASGTGKPLISAGDGRGVGIFGTNTNDNPGTGQYGEFVSATINTGSSVALATGVSSNVASITLGAGDWDVEGCVCYTFGATTSYTNLVGGASSVTGVLPTQQNVFDFETPATVPTAGADMSWVIPKQRFSLSASTTIFLVAQGTFTVSTLKAYGTIRARRVR